MACCREPKLGLKKLLLRQKARERNMNNNEFEKLIKTLASEALPPKGLKERILSTVMVLGQKAEPVLTPFERFVFEKPFRAACAISAFVSGTLWAVLGSEFASLISGFIG